MKDNEIQHFPGDFRAQTSLPIRKVDGCNPTSTLGERWYTSYIYHIYYVCIYILCVLNILCLSIEILCICIHIIHVNCLAGCCSFIVWQATWLDAVFTAFIGGFFASTAFLAPRVSMLRPRSSGSLGRSGGSKDNCQMLPGLWRYLSICKIYKCNIYPAWN